MTESANSNDGYFDGLRIYRFNRFKRHVAHHSGPFDTWAVNVVARGQLYFAREHDERRVLTGPFAFWTTPGVDYHYGPVDDQGWDHRFISVHGSRARRLWNALLVNDGEPWRELCDNGEAIELCDELLETLGRHEPDAPLVVHKLEGLVLAIASQPVGNGPIEQALRSLARDIDADPTSDWNMEAIARSHAWTDGHLRRLFKDACGLAPKRYVRRARLRYAAEQLRSTSISIESIGASIGMDDPAYFSRSFTEFSGMPPGRYRAAFASPD